MLSTDCTMPYGPVDEEDEPFRMALRLLFSAVGRTDPLTESEFILFEANEGRIPVALIELPLPLIIHRGLRRVKNALAYIQFGESVLCTSHGSSTFGVHC